MSQKHLEARFQDFQTFDEPSLIEAREEAIRLCAAMASGTAPGYWLSLLGPSGTGKTMLAKAITRFFRRNLDFLYDEARPDARVLRKGGLKVWAEVVGDMLAGDYSGIRDLRDDWFVCLDDIGAEYDRNRDLSTAKLYEILNAREGRFTVITGNFNLATLAAKFDARISSRLLRHGNTVVDVMAPDFNLRT